MSKSKQDLSQDDVMTWAMFYGGLSHTMIAKALKCHPNTVGNRLRKIGNWVAEEFDINKLRMPLYALYPQMVNSVMTNLNKCDVTMTLGVMRGLQILVDKTEQGKTAGDYTDHELRVIAREALGIVASEEADSDNELPRTVEA